MALLKASQRQEEEQAHTRSHTRDLAGLLMELVAGDEKARRWAARDLAAFPEASRTLVRRAMEETDQTVREAIFVSLTELGDEIAVNGLIECLRSEDAAVRNDAIEALKSMPEAVAPIMTSLLQDPDSDVRIFAVNVLESLRHPNVELWLIDVIEHDPHVNVCATAVDLLGEVGSREARDSLERLKRRFEGEPYIGFATDLALRRIIEA